MAIMRLAKKVKKVGRKIKQVAGEGVKAVKTVKKVAGKVKQTVKTAGKVVKVAKDIPAVLKYGAREFKKASLPKKLALVAAAPLAPVAYGASHGFRKPVKAAKLGYDIATGPWEEAVIKKKISDFHVNSIGEDWAALVKKAKESK